MIPAERLRQLPSVHEVLSRLGESARGYPHALVVSEVRRALDAIRDSVLHDGARTGESVESLVARNLSQLAQTSLRRVINATGVVLHTNLGRAPLGSVSIFPGYSNLEYDVASGRRGRRDDHIAPLLEKLLGKPAIAVNNGAAALYLALHELAAGGEVIVSRGELIEIGDGFRIPEIMQRSGAVLREVGTTNRTRLSDYADAITDRTRLLLRVHPSNFRITGFTSRTELRELVELGRERAIPVYEDLGSGCVIDLKPFGISEPLVRDSIQAGVDLVSFSGDKLLGGPQAGILAGNSEIISRLRRNPMFRALRLDKMVYQALEGTLRDALLHDGAHIPALRMIRLTEGEIRQRAEHLLAAVPKLRASLEAGQSVIGGGSTPEQPIQTCLICIPRNPLELERKLRYGLPPVVARIESDRLLLDLRTVFPEEEAELAAALQALS
ncbi:MAG: L-seryl-tRNA(Sec) selenium transferase [Bryobacteraceae bacterium]